MSCSEGRSGRWGTLVRERTEQVVQDPCSPTRIGDGAVARHSDTIRRELARGLLETLAADDTRSELLQNTPFFQQVASTSTTTIRRSPATTAFTTSFTPSPNKRPANVGLVEDPSQTVQHTQTVGRRLVMPSNLEST